MISSAQRRVLERLRDEPTERIRTEMFVGLERDPHWHSNYRGIDKRTFAILKKHGLIDMTAHTHSFRSYRITPKGLSTLKEGEE